MTYRELYDSALRIVSETEQDSGDADYEERAGYLLATFCNECSSIDKSYRTAHKIPAISFSPATVVNLSDSFPLHEALAPAAVYYLGAMLVSDENEPLSDRLFSLYTDAIATIQSGLPCLNHTIVNHYPDLLS